MYLHRYDRSQENIDFWSVGVVEKLKISLSRRSQQIELSEMQARVLFTHFTNEPIDRKIPCNWRDRITVMSKCERNF